MNPFNFELKKEISLTTTTIVKYKEKAQFAVVPGTDSNGKDIFRIKDVKGCFEITKIKTCPNAYARSDSEINVLFDPIYGTFYPHGFSNGTYLFTLLIKPTEVNNISYDIKIQATEIQHLELNEFLQFEFCLPGYDDMKFTYYVKKILDNAKSSEKNIQIKIENPYNVKIEEKYGDYVKKENGSNDIDLNILFAVNLCASTKFDKRTSNVSNSEVVVPQTEDNQNPVKNEVHKETQSVSKWYEIMSNNRYADVIFITTDKTKILSHRTILSKVSPVFENIFETTSEYPVTINVEDFDVDTIQAAINFLYDKIDSIVGKEIEVFKFAVKFNVMDLMESCCSFFVKSITPENVCEYIQIAYSNNFERMKKKCMKLLVEKKKEIDPSTLTNLPKNILLDFFSY